MNDDFRVKGRLTVYKVSGDNRTVMFDKQQTINSTLYTNLRNKLTARDAAGKGASVDAIAWGSWRDPSAGSFIDSDYAGTTSAGTQGGLVQSNVGTNQAKFSGTFSFSTTKQINFFELGQGYTAAASAVTSLFTSRYAYDNSLLTGSTYITYVNGESMIVDWTIQLGA